MTNSHETLDAAIARLLKAKRGSKEFALFRFEEGNWMAEVGSASPLAAHRFNGALRSEITDTPLKAVQDLIEQIEKAQEPAKS